MARTPMRGPARAKYGEKLPQFEHDAEAMWHKKKIKFQDVMLAPSHPRCRHSVVESRKWVDWQIKSREAVR